VDRLEAMSAFVVTVDRGSLSRAARELGRSIATVSRAISALEERAGEPLLRRTTRALRLTDAGERHLEVFRRVLAELDAVERGTRRAHAEPAGVLTVTAPATFGAMHVRPVVDDYLRAHPNVRVRLLLLDRVVDVVGEGVDAAVRIAHLPDSALVATHVGSVRRVLCASPAYLAKHGRPATPRALSGHRCISFTALTPSAAWSFGAGPEGGRSIHVRIDPVLEVNVAEAAIASAIDGAGITSALSYQVARAIRSGDLVPLLRAFEPEPLPVHLVQPAGSRVLARVRAFIEMAVPALRAALDTRGKRQPRALS
jgi:DNA-binding transcriptional LysR family regulator